ncbi:hypothetical protein CNN82_15520 [Pseudomonas frederiksbergensis]|uniref:Transposase n=1 Tax=Pseudomonas frederiksbergensis TaxID=104087 RepID=A0AB33EFZ8_9PSED|nr:hypothetical protein CNN82_15520 [Pseudomonas frederiksbergensis]
MSWRQIEIQFLIRQGGRVFNVIKSILHTILTFDHPQSIIRQWIQPIRNYNSSPGFQNLARNMTG